MGKNNVSYIPIQGDYKTCPFFVPAKCYHSSGKGFYKDWCKIQKKYIKTKCLFCDGVGKLFPKGDE